MEFPALEGVAVKLSKLMMQLSEWRRYTVMEELAKRLNLTSNVTDGTELVMMEKVDSIVTYFCFNTRRAMTELLQFNKNLVTTVLEYLFTYLNGEYDRTISVATVDWKDEDYNNCVDHFRQLAGGASVNRGTVSIDCFLN